MPTFPFSVFMVFRQILLSPLLNNEHFPPILISFPYIAKQFMQRLLLVVFKSLTTTPECAFLDKLLFQVL